MRSASNDNLLQLVNLISARASGLPRLSLTEWRRWAKTFLRSGASSKQTAEEAALWAHQQAVACEPGSCSERIALAAAAVSWAVVHASENRDDLARRSTTLAAYLARVRPEALGTPLFETRRYQ